MSTKIYEAYRFPFKRLNEFIAYTRTRMLEGFFAKVDHLMVFGFSPEKVRAIREEVATRKWLQRTDHRERYEEMAIFRELCTKLREASLGSLKSGYDVDASWNFWIHKEWVYAIPYGKYQHGAAELDYVEDFAYWDNTDAPDDVSQEDFYARGDVWTEVCLDDWNGLRLNHVVVDFSNPIPHAAFLAEQHLLKKGAESGHAGDGTEVVGATSQQVG